MSMHDPLDDYPETRDEDIVAKYKIPSPSEDAVDAGARELARYCGATVDAKLVAARVWRVMMSAQHGMGGAETLVQLKWPEY